MTCPFQIPKRTLENVHASLKLIYFHRRTCPFWNSKVGLFHGRPILFKFKKELQQAFMLPWNWYVFIGNLSILKFKSLPIFTSDMSVSNLKKKNSSRCPCFPEIGLFSWTICLFQIPKRTLTSVLASLKLVNFHRRLAHFEIQKVVYFHGQPTIFKFQKEL